MPGIRRWGLWQQKPALIAFVLTVEIAVLALAAASSWPVRIRVTDVIRLLVLAGCALVYTRWTQEPEERRRGATPVEHVDQTSVWVFTAAAVLPLPAAALLLVLIRACRFQIARRSPYRFVYTTIAQLGSATAVHLLTTASPARAWVRGQRPWLAAVDGSILRAVATVVVCILAYAVVQHTLLRTVRAVARAAPLRSLPALLRGPRDANQLIVLTLCLAGATSVIAAAASVWLIVPTVLPLVIYWTRAEQLRAHLTAQIEDITREAGHDPLTGLPNRRLFDPRAQLALLGPAAVLFIDLDEFGTWNKKIGHLAADQLLQAAGTHLTSLCRTRDVPGRFGGEELVLVLPGASPDDAVAVAQRYRRAMENTRLTVTTGTNRKVHIGQPEDPDQRTDDAILPPCTVTIGIALAPDHGDDLTALLRVANAAMYAGKTAGRNRVVLAGTPGPDGQPRLFVQPRETEHPTTTDTAQQASPTLTRTKLTM